MPPHFLVDRYKRGWVGIGIGIGRPTRELGGTHLNSRFKFSLEPFGGRDMERTTVPARTR